VRLLLAYENCSRIKFQTWLGSWF